MVFIRAWHADLPDDVQEQELTAGQVSIGRALDNDVLLDIPGASRYHARLELDQGQLWVVDLDSTNGTWVGGERVTRHPLGPGDRFQIGAMVFEVADASLTRPTVVEDWSPVQLAAGRRPAGVRLRRERGAGASAWVSVVEVGTGLCDETVREVPARGLAIGRDPTNDLCLADADVSRFHARIESRADGFVLQDLGSRNGTWVNRIRVRQHLLVDGDSFVLGGFTLRFSRQPPPTTASVQPHLSPAFAPDADTATTAVLPRSERRCHACGARLEPRSERCPACGSPTA